ncbi:MAG: tRNA (5-methylaminomethyl-2-thiouridine)(34)-methyltransferase MnmD [Bacteroidales bacterium]
MKGPQIVKTADGSDTIYLPEIDETYHSIFGAVQESKHVFIENGIENIDKDTIRVLEVGFGTGLNALLTAIYAVNNQKNIEFFTIENNPLDDSLVSHLSYAKHLNADEMLFKKIHQADWEKMVKVNSHFSICKLHIDILRPKSKLPENIDMVFFDAFAPSKQIEIWDKEVFGLLYNVLNPNGFLVTYSSAGVVKNALKSVGFTVKRLKGPPGKHHMVLASRPVPMASNIVNQETKKVTAYSTREEFLNIITHAFGLLASVPATIAMVLKTWNSEGWIKIASAFIFGISLILLYLASTLYHASRKPARRMRLNVFDHAAIYVLIAGTYTPFLLITLSGSWGWSLFGVVWGLAAIGVALKILYQKRYKAISAIAYVLMGWIIVVALNPLIENLDPWGLYWLMAGGISYTLGAVLYVFKKIPYNHAIFHLFVLIGSITHWISIYYFVL